MESDLPSWLTCTICPKLPSFSDTSHLLTHVRSKGHLSHLHKLQVRSHQEIAAGAQLAIYNQWYQDNGLGQLLSERMVMKEAKQAGRRAEAMRRGATITPQAPRKTAMHPRDSAGKAGTSKPPRVARKRPRRSRARKTEEGESDLDFSLKKRSGKRKQKRARMTTPTDRDTDQEIGIPSDEDAPAEPDDSFIGTPEHSKLKGTVWPGMDLFDAATDDMKRMRNQKKDGSVLRKMERLSALVQPTEAVYSETGELRKERHLDDLEDDSSLIEGETPVPKAKSVRTRKRQPLEVKDENVPRLVRRKTTNRSRVSRSKADQVLSGLPPLPSLPSSSTLESLTVGSRFLPTEDTDFDIKPILSSTSSRRRPSQFAIFNDGSPSRGLSLPSMHERNPLYSAQSSFLGGPRPQLSTLTAGWLQPQHHPSMQHPNVYNAYRPANIGQFAEAEKESAMTLEETGSVLRATNPLTWRSPLRETQGIVIASDSPFANFLSFFPSVSDIEDPFVATKNPLTEAISQAEGSDGEHDHKIHGGFGQDIHRHELTTMGKSMPEIMQ
ncbi:hypothetical protein PV10_02171 [Exophiala mesophila]|uniref:Uncharacterized protein n=1 Tax=Exophiala mesophila TaxID=212818 RepID=A0A0D1ZII6_EXOME|nr:uncharacterized protein PV10_02171 [Exophiala mesophila]KIV94402.1 hypothetical protein PV10_02171 [Exophiala mesophila]